MSDTNAMKPKEPPKTCGTCRFGEPAVHCPFGDHYYDYDEKTENFTHGCWEKQTDTLEQRYETVIAALLVSEERNQQLEQVAKDMCFELEHRIGVSYRKELKTCGVILDD